MSRTAEEVQEIAQTIVEQIKFGDPAALFAWGAENFCAIPSCEHFQGGLAFSVNGLCHKGTVKVQLRWVDDYTVTFFNRAGEEVKKDEEVYCDMLVSIIDWIEGR